MNDKDLGAFFTPKKLVEFMISFVNEQTEFNTVLEPSMGDGAFVRHLDEGDIIIDAVEINDETVKCVEGKFSDRVSIICDDFLEYQTEKKYDLIIGNPPYISSKKMSANQKEISSRIIGKYELSDNISKNIWVPFLLKSIDYLEDDGSIFFVLPYEFLLVDYAKKLRVLLEEAFSYINIFVFNERAFPDIQQEICLVYLTNKSHVKNAKPYISLEVFDKIDFHDNPIHSGKIERNKPIEKWANSILSDDDLEFLYKAISKFKTGSQLFTSKPGIVSAANDFFIVSDENSKKYKFDKYTVDIIPKSQSVGDKLIYNESDHRRNIETGRKSKLMNLKGIKSKEFSNKLYDYLREGKSKGINERYKCKLRKRWYDIRLVEPGMLIFFKRYHIIPRIVINEAESYCTDSGYNLYVLEEYDPKSIAFCFYNSLTLTMCEFYGRFYGGGVCELTPSEFKRVPIPVKVIESKDILELDRKLRSNEEYNEVVKYVDDIVLSSIFTNDEMCRIEEIRKKLLDRRMKM